MARAPSCALSLALLRTPSQPSAHAHAPAGPPPPPPEEHRNVLLRARGRQAAHIDAARVAGGLLRGGATKACTQARAGGGRARGGPYSALDLHSQHPLPQQGSTCIALMWPGLLSYLINPELQA